MKSFKIISVFLFLALVLSACVTNRASDNQATNDVPDDQPSQSGPSGDPSAKGPTSNPPGNNKTQERCGLEFCHGMNFSCGENIPDFCTEEYQFGDFCRQYAICEFISDECQLVPSTKLDTCKECIRDCEGMTGEPAFECEFACRDKI